MDGTLLSSLYAFCAGNPWLAELGWLLGAGGVALALFLVGLMGGLTHCAGMCGPFVLAQIAGDGERLAAPALGELHRLRAALLLPYHLGRFTTYVALGAAAGGIAGLAVELSGYRWLPALPLGFAAMLFLAQGLAGLTRRLGIKAGIVVGNALGGPLTRLARPLLANPRGLRGYGLGIALGFLPCGLLYGAVSAAAGTGGAWQGALAMAAFALGTVPSLVLVGYIGMFFRSRAPGAARAFGVPLMLINAGFLGFFALRAFG